ncbi:lysozyme inhibitor LprI family protein [Enterobacter hormaechei]|uniref:lysozyme inhibitor LprI family protein n=1 Tax=Enterobacter hormaechei TaxID=158836 RepID=UPI0032DABAB5
MAITLSPVITTSIALMIVLPVSAFAASFSCTNVTTPDEKTICANRELSEKDVRMATTYSLLRKALLMGGRAALQDEQSEWLNKRRHCGENMQCLSHLYNERIEMLNIQYEQVVASRNE